MQGDTRQAGGGESGRGEVNSFCCGRKNVNEKEGRLFYLGCERLIRGLVARLREGFAAGGTTLSGEEDLAFAGVESTREGVEQTIIRHCQ